MGVILFKSLNSLLVVVILKLAILLAAPELLIGALELKGGDGFEGDF